MTAVLAVFAVGGLAGCSRSTECGDSGGCTPLYRVTTNSRADGPVVDVVEGVLTAARHGDVVCFELRDDAGVMSSLAFPERWHAYQAGDTGYILAGQEVIAARSDDRVRVSVSARDRRAVVGSCPAAGVLFTHRVSPSDVSVPTTSR